ncbi:unnamed protein product [Sympodiomycopsis kandeliae]
MSGFPSHPTWDDIEAAVVSDPPTPSNSGHYSNDSHVTRPTTWRTNDKDVTDIGQERLDDWIRLWKCNHCGKPVLARYKSFHKQNCNLARAIAENRIPRSVLEPEPSKRKRRLSDVSDTPSNFEADEVSNASPQKKLTKKAARALEVQERKKIRLEKKARKEKEAAEAKGRRKKGQPLDVNRQCGVINDNGQPCQRSLTCKTHAMGAKRAVEGRSRPYDELLLEWQKANNPAFLAKLEKREEERAKAMEEKRVKKLEKKKKKDAVAAAAAASGSGASGSIPSHLLGANGKRLVIGPDGQAGQWVTNPIDGQKTFINSSDPNATLQHPEALTSQYANDLYSQSNDSNKLQSEVDDLLNNLDKHFTDDKISPLPLVSTRSFHGLYTHRVKRFLMLRQALSGTGRGASHHSANYHSYPNASGTNTGTSSTSSSYNSDFRPPPIVAGGGWGPGMFASHS